MDEDLLQEELEKKAAADAAAAEDGKDGGEGGKDDDKKKDDSKLDETGDKKDKEIDKGGEDGDDDKSDEADTGDDDSDDDADDGDDDAGEDDSVVAELVAASGYEFTDEAGNPIEFEDSTEGVIKFSQALAEKKAQEQVNSFIQKNPEIKAYHDHLLAGGKKEDYFSQRQTFEGVDIPKDNAELQERIVKEDLKAQGLSDERINRMVKAFKDSDSLFDEAKDAQKNLIDTDKREKAEAVERNKEAIKQREEDSKKYWEGVSSEISKGKLENGFTIPEKNRQEFLEYLSKPINESGLSQAIKNYADLSIDERLTIDYMIKEITEKKISIMDYISQVSTTKQAKGLSARLKGKGTKGGSSGSSGDGGDKNKSKDGDRSNPSLEDIGVGDIVFE